MGLFKSFKMKKNMLFLIYIVIFLVMIFLIAKAFSPGSYNGVLRFKVEVSEREVVEKIDSIKKVNKSDIYLRKMGYVDGRKDSTDHWYHFYVYYSDTDEIINCWVRGDYDGGATIAVVSINSNDKWMRLDKDFNNKEKKSVEKRFLKEYINLIE